MKDMDDRYKNTGYGSVERAVYKDTIIKSDNDNIFIKAIPFPLEQGLEQQRYYFEGLPLFDREAYMQQGKLQKRILLKEIENIRIFLPFHETLEFLFYNKLITSYRKRRLVVNLKTDTYKLVGDVGAGTDSGFALIGKSGCGKSSSLKSLTSHYPQTIIHKTDKGEIAQILYLVVSCLPNSNFRAMYVSIGKAIDEALHINIYEEMISKKKTLGAQQQKIVELIETYAIGTIIFDEIQLIDFSSTKEASFESLMTMSNQTKMLITVVGTTDSFDSMMKSPRTIRRVGDLIDASEYCRSKEWTAYILGKLAPYQITDTKIKITNDLIDAIHSETKGIIKLIISLYVEMQDYYIENDLKCPIDGKFAVRVFKKRFAKLRKVLQSEYDEDYETVVASYINEFKKNSENKTNELKQIAVEKSLPGINDNIDTSEYEKAVIKSVQEITDRFSDKQISKETRKIIGSMSTADINIDALTTVVLKKLIASEKPDTPKISKEEIIDFILEQKQED